MTIIAIKDGEMAADSGVWNGNRRYTVAIPKITRAPDGSLWALTGKASDGFTLREWAASGADQDRPPMFDGKDDDAPCVILMKPDGSIWYARGLWRFAPHVGFVCSGESDASHFCEGAMAAGLSVGAAVALTIEHHNYAVGPVQIERLSPQLIDPKCLITPSSASDWMAA